MGHVASFHSGRCCDSGPQQVRRDGFPEGLARYLCNDFPNRPGNYRLPVEEIQRALVSAFDKSSKAGRASFHSALSHSTTRSSSPPVSYALTSSRITLPFSFPSSQTCPFRKLYPHVAMVQSRHNRNGCNG